MYRADQKTITIEQVWRQNGQEHEVKHTLRQADILDRKAWSATVNDKENGGYAQAQVELYDRLIIRVEGYGFEDQDLMGTTEDWKNHIPVDHKLDAISQIEGRRVKNS